MKMLKHYSFILSALCFLLVTSMKCKKDYIEKNELPPITQTGANTFGCYVNGEIFLPRGSGMNIIITAKRTGNSFYIKISDGSNVARMIILEIEYNAGIKTLKCTKFSQGGTCSMDNCTAINNNLINLQIDESKKIISGEFNAILTATTTCPEVKITDGRFDLKYTEN